MKRERQEDGSSLRDVNLCIVEPLEQRPTSNPHPFSPTSRDIHDSNVRPGAELSVKEEEEYLMKSTPTSLGKDKSTLAHDSALPETFAATASALVIAAADKAGMDGNDKERIANIILRESGNSLYMRQQRKRDDQVNQRISLLRKQLSEHEQTNKHWQRSLQQQLDNVTIPQLLKDHHVARSTACVVDMDMFYMACELLSRPELRNVPACVGRGMILTSNYEARKYGVRAALPGYIGDALVRELSNNTISLVHVPTNFDLYREKALVVRSVLAQYDPHFLRAYSLDEAFLELGPYLALKLLLRRHRSTEWQSDSCLPAQETRNSSSPGGHEDHHLLVRTLQSILKSTEALSDADRLTSDAKTSVMEKFPECFDLPALDDLRSWSANVLLDFPCRSCQEVMSEVVREMRQRVEQATGGLTCSAGIGPNFMLAKIASDRNKPNGQLLVGHTQADIDAFLHPLPVRKLPGIGRVTEKTLAAFGIGTVRDLFEQRALVQFLFKPVSAGFLLRSSLGCASSWSTSEKAGEGVDDDDIDSSPHGQKGISRERTFSSGKSWTEINSKLEDIAQMLSADMGRKQLRARTITVKVKLHTFDCLSKSHSFTNGRFIQTAQELCASAADLLRDIRADFKGSFNVRLLGIRCTNFHDTSCQGDLNGMNIERFLQKKGDAESVDQEPGSYDLDANLSLPAIQQEETSPLSQPKTRGARSGFVSVSRIKCPLCSRSLDGLSNEVINQHLDTCLSYATLQEAAREMQCIERSDTLGVKKRPCIANYFARGSK
jgi:DNA polymerase kappa